MIAIFPGSFDPIHEGHINIIKKAMLLFDKLYIIVSFNGAKKNQSNIQERYQKVKVICKEISDKIEVKINKNELTSDIAQNLQATYIVRGLRSNKDLQYEIELAYANKNLNPNLETIFFISDYGLSKISSTLIKEINQIKQNK